MVSPLPTGHSRLQSCVGTRARLDYAAFDAQLRKAYFVTTFPRYTYVCARISSLETRFLTEHFLAQLFIAERLTNNTTVQAVISVRAACAQTSVSRFT